LEEVFESKKGEFSKIFKKFFVFWQK